jgi:hypothetical protein
LQKRTDDEEIVEVKKERAAKKEKREKQTEEEKELRKEKKLIKKRVRTKFKVPLNLIMNVYKSRTEKNHKSLKNAEKMKTRP